MDNKRAQHKRAQLQEIKDWQDKQARLLYEVKRLIAEHGMYAVRAAVNIAQAEAWVQEKKEKRDA